MSTETESRDFAQFFDNRLFDGIQSGILDGLEAQIGVLHLKEGEVIFREGERGDLLYLVGAGSVKISKEGRGGQQETLGVIRSGNFFGGMALLDHEPRSVNATAAEPTTLGTLSEETFQEILELAPSRLHMNFLRCISERLRNVNEHFIAEVMRTERLTLVGSMANSIIHDLKNPITIVRCCSDLIANEMSDPRLCELISMLDSAVDGMLAMTQELLDYSRGSTHLTKERVTIWRLLDELNQQSLRLLPGKNIQFAKRIRYDGEVELDLPRFTRVLCNLIKNASEAMDSGGVLMITSDLVQGYVVLRISDTGKGIPTEILPTVFEPFVSHGKAHGTGLGMSIAKSIVEAHDGKISIASVVDHGTTVDIRLPAPLDQMAA